MIEFQLIVMIVSY